MGTSSNVADPAIFSLAGLSSLCVQAGPCSAVLTILVALCPWPSSPGADCARRFHCLPTPKLLLSPSPLSCPPLRHPLDTAANVLLLLLLPPPPAPPDDPSPPLYSIPIWFRSLYALLLLITPPRPPPQRQSYPPLIPTAHPPPPPPPHSPHNHPPTTPLHLIVV